MSDTKTKKNIPYVARQPIFDCDINVVSYEILFRNSDINEFQEEFSKNELNSFVLKNGKYTSKDIATMQILSRFLTISDIETLTNGKKAFINFTTNLVEKRFWKQIPQNSYVFEIENDEKCSSETFIKLCNQVKSCGFKIAVTIKNNELINSSILQIADYIKVKFNTAKTESHRYIIEQLSDYKVPMIAENIESKKDFFDAAMLGFTYFQGFFFCRPEMIPAEDIPAFKMNYINIIKETVKIPFNFESIELIIRQDVSLTYKLLKYINSAYFSVRNKVSSIKNALVLLGEDELKKWILMISLTCIGKDKPDELIITALFRAKFCELLCVDIFKNVEPDDAFILGMFSLIDTFLGKPMNEIIDDIAISDGVKGALLGENNDLYIILNLAMEYEKCHWDSVYNFLIKNRVNNIDLAHKYFESIEWAERIYSC